MSRDRILVTGATGYIGGRLVPRLLDHGYRVRCLVRSQRKLEARPWAARQGSEGMEGDAKNPDDLRRALAGCRYAYYLLHSMVAVGSRYAELDQQMALDFAAAAEAEGVDRIIFLGGLGEAGDKLSHHLESRREVEEALASTSVPVTVLRAAMIIGSGSASFEMLRYLVERLPIMITPRWVATECQPIAIRDVLRYLVPTLDRPETTGETLDVGGADVLSYRELMLMTARELGLSKRVILPVPFLPLLLSWLWIHLVTPLSYRIARPLAEGLRNRVVCRDDRAQRLMGGTLLTAEEAIHLAALRSATDQVVTSWSDAGVIPGDPVWAGGTAFRDQRQVRVKAGVEEAFRAIRRIGGGNGWYTADILWRIRGFLDRLVGGPGLRRGRRNPENLGFGDALDFWRVAEIEPDHLLRLRAEMKLPGTAWLEFRLHGEADGTCSVQQTATFVPRGLFGLAYWYVVLPLHGIVFSGMLEGIRRSAESSR